MSSMRGFLGYPSAGGASADHMTSIFTAYGILAALLARERLGVGQEIDTSLTGSMVFLQHHSLTSTFFHKQELVRRVDRKANPNPLAIPYECQDGKWFLLMVLASDIVWPDVCQALGIQELEKDPRFENARKRAQNNRELVEILDKIFATKARDEWVEIIGKYHRIMFSPVNEALEVAEDPQIVDNKYVVEYEQQPFGKIKTTGCPVIFRETPAGIQRPAPDLGQHTEEVLLELGGYSWDEIAKLKEDEVIG